MIDPIWLKSFLKPLVLPPTGLLLLTAVGLAIRGRFPRGGAFLAWTGVLALLALSLPVVSALLTHSLDSSPPFDIARTAGAQAVVILGGGTRNAPEYGGLTLGPLTLDRVRYGARVARLTRLPILVSGGSVYGGEAEGKMMQESLEREFGLGARWVEDTSRTTHENALRSSEILRAAGINRIVLVTHSFDMRRAVAEFAAVGIACVRAPTGIVSLEPMAAIDFVPSISGLVGSYYALYEILANFARLVGLA